MLGFGLNPVPKKCLDDKLYSFRIRIKYDTIVAIHGSPPRKQDWPKQETAGVQHTSVPKLDTLKPTLQGRKAKDIFFIATLITLCT